jgi:hypothetical protein
MKKNIFIGSLLFQIVIIVNCFAQNTAPSILWQKSLGGSNSEFMDYFGTRQTQTSDGGYILIGSSTSNDGDVSGNHGNEDYWIVKLNANRNIIWQKSLGGSGRDVPYGVQQTSDGGYIVAGNSNSIDGDVTGNHGLEDFWVVKLNSSGSITWQKSLGGSKGDAGFDIQQTSDGGYIVAGNSESIDGDVSGNHGLIDMWVVKLNVSGSITWQKSFGGSNNDFASSIQQTSDGGYIVFGESYSNDGDVSGNHGDVDYWVVKLNSGGIITWQKSLGGSNPDWGAAIQQTNDGGYIVAGNSQSSNGDVSINYGNEDFWIVKLNSSGSITWQKSLGGSALDAPYSIKQTIDGGYIILGYTGSFNGDVSGNHGGPDAWIVKLNSSGNMTWQKCLGGSYFDYGIGIQQLSNGAYIVAGTSSSNDWDVNGNHGNTDLWIMKLYNGNCINSVTANGPVTFCSGGSVTLTANSGTDYLWSTGATTQSIVVNATGTYTAYVDGCQYGQAVNVFVRSNPPASINASGATTFCSGGSVTLNANTGTNLKYQWLKGGIPIFGDTLSSANAISGGTYKVVVTDVFGCSKTSTGILVTVKPLPSASITADGPIAFCNGDSVIFTTSSGAGYTYQWQRNNIAISGATSISYTAKTQGNYKVTVTHSNGCSKTSAKKTVTIPCRENDETVFAEGEINAFPVPVIDVLNLEIKNFDGNGWISVMNVLGQTVATVAVNFDAEHLKNIDMKNFSSGFYTVVIKNSKKQEMVKVIKK